MTDPIEATTPLPQRRDSRSARELRRDLQSSATDGGCFSMMVGLGETYFAAFFLTVGLGDLAVGILATVPYLLGSLLQLSTPWGIERFSSYRRWMVFNASLQATSLIGLGLLAWFRAANFSTILLLVSVYWGAGLATAPAWNTWIEHLIPTPVRAKFLSKRMRICQLCLLVGVTSAGFLLRIAEQTASALDLFAGLLLAAGLCRYGSALMLNRQSENRNWFQTSTVRPAPARPPQPAKPELDRALRRVIPYFLLIQFAVYVSGPYFVPFMLRIMELSYPQFALLIVLGYLGRIATLHWAGNVAKYFGQATLLWIGGIGIIPASGLWIFYSSYPFLCLLQFVGGAAWACYELAMALVFIEKIPNAQRVKIISRYNLANGVAMVSGSLLGGLLLQTWSGTAAGFLAIFLLSTALRIAALACFPFGLLSQNKSSSAGLVYMFYPSPEPNGRTFLRPFYAVPAKAISVPASASANGREEPGEQTQEQPSPEALPASPRSRTPAAKIAAAPLPDLGAGDPLSSDSSFTSAS